VLALSALITLFVGFLQALWGPLVLATASPKTFGIVQTIATSGMLVGGGLLSLFAQSKNPTDVLAMALTTAGLFFALMGFSSQVIFITSFGFLFFLTLPFVNMSLDILIRSNVPNHMQGRIWSFVSLISQSGLLVALSIAGYLSDHVFGPALMPDGMLATSIGKIIGVGPGRGIGCIFLISGMTMMFLSPLLNRLQVIRSLA